MLHAEFKLSNSFTYSTYDIFSRFKNNMHDTDKHFPQETQDKQINAPRLSAKCRVNSLLFEVLSQIFLMTSPVHLLYCKGKAN